MFVKLDLLVVDDDPLITRAMERLLRSRYAVRVASNMVDALNSVRERCPDLILCDYDIEERTGDELLRAVTGRFPEVRRIVLAAQPSSLLQSLLDSGVAHAYLSKPCPTEILLDTLACEARKHMIGRALPSSSN